MLTVKEAVQKAREYAQDMYEGERVNNLLLEEAVLDDSQTQWQITFGYDSSRIRRIKETPLHESLAMFFRSKTSVQEETLRDYKTFIINAENGAFGGMKIRELT
jgi:hypothetical protein